MPRKQLAYEVWYSEEDKCYLARYKHPELKWIMADGETKGGAVKELKLARRCAIRAFEHWKYHETLAYKLPNITYRKTI